MWIYIGIDSICLQHPIDIFIIISTFFLYHSEKLRRVCIYNCQVPLKWDATSFSSIRSLSRFVRLAGFWSIFFHLSPSTNFLGIMVRKLLYTNRLFFCSLASYLPFSVRFIEEALWSSWACTVQIQRVLHEQCDRKLTILPSCFEPRMWQDIADHHHWLWHILLHFDVCPSATEVVISPGPSLAIIMCEREEVLLGGAAGIQMDLVYIPVFNF